MGVKFTTLVSVNVYLWLHNHPLNIVSKDTCYQILLDLLHSFSHNTYFLAFWNTMSDKIGLFYGSTTCYTEMAAEKIQAAIGEELVDIFDIKDTPITKALNYDILIFGISTWDFGELQEDWESTWDDVSQLNLKDKVVALYGLGDQLGYADWYQDALGMLHDELIPTGCQLIGYSSIDGHEFTKSKALTESGDAFVGLALDDENQFDLSEERINEWTGQILEEMIE